MDTNLALNWPSYHEVPFGCPIQVNLGVSGNMGRVKALNSRGPQPVVLRWEASITENTRSFTTAHALERTRPDR
jgi:hypothetical protein